MSISYYVSWLGLVSLVALPAAQGEIYTYERDGVIVISSEPPPKRLRPQRRTKPHRAQPRRAKPRNKRPRSLEQSRKQSRKQSRRDQRAQHKGSRWVPSRSLSRYRNTLVEAAARYQLPARLLWSVISHCRELGEPSRSQRRYDLSSCLSKEVQQKLALEKPPKEKPLQGSMRSTTGLTKRERAARQLQGIASLLRRLINHFRGDVTLTLTAYPHASQSPAHYIFSRSDRALKLSNLLAPRISQGISQGISERNEPLSSEIEPSSQHKLQLRARRLAFTREALKLYHRLAREEE